MRFRRFVVSVVLCVVAAGCGTGDGPESSPRSAQPDTPTPVPPLTAAPTTAPPTTASPSVSPEPTGARGTRIITADSDFGPMLFDASGQPIYLFTAEPGDRPACYDECAEDWPPALTTDAPRAGGDVRPELLGSTGRSDGSTQVTYAGHPLYYYAHEGKYQVLCHDVEEYGGTWLVVRPDGTPAPG